MQTTLTGHGSYCRAGYDGNHARVSCEGVGPDRLVLVLSVDVETRNVVEVTHVRLGWPEAVRDAWDRSDVMCWPASP